MKHSHSGRVSAINESHDGSHVRVEVVHGKRKRSDPKDETSRLVGYDRPTSTVAMPKAHAKGLSIGQRVNVGMSPQDAEDPFEDDGDEAQEQAPPKKAPPVSRNKGSKKAAAGSKKKGRRGGFSKPGGAIGQVMGGGVTGGY